ncbi:hypothetical protein HDU67_005863 [Dinochytrium kinnereticum]|nr:hypothetical protein HDU67_005863 [Dinochytrium kinnereticum]
MSGKGRAPSAGPSGNPPAKTTEIQAQVDEVISVMHNNIEKVIARGEKLDSLQNKTDDLQQGALQFKRGAAKVKSQIRVQLTILLQGEQLVMGEDLKLKLIIAGIIIVVLIVIIVPLVTTFRNTVSTPSQASGSA